MLDNVNYSLERAREYKSTSYGHKYWMLRAQIEAAIIREDHELSTKLHYKLAAVKDGYAAELNAELK